MSPHPRPLPAFVRKAGLAQAGARGEGEGWRGDLLKNSEVFFSLFFCYFTSQQEFYHFPSPASLSVGEREE